MIAVDRISIPCETTASTDVIRRNVAATLARGTPFFVRDGSFRLDRVRVVAGGMSALDAPLEPEPGFVTLAVNGAMKLFRDRGLAPDYWMSCEPRDHIAGHLLDVPDHTTYLPASQCSPAVFERLAGKKVMTWHAAPATTADMVRPGDHLVLGSSSSTLTAMSLLVYMGFLWAETWGWDGCYRDGAHHSGTAPPDDPRNRDVEIEVGDRVFATRTSWALEAQEAMWMLDHLPLIVEIRGDGMLASIREHIAAVRQGNIVGAPPERLAAE